MRWEEVLKIKQNWTAEQARNDLERLIITGERPADKVVGMACKALDKQIPKKVIHKDELYCCPCCGDVGSILIEDKYCSVCGQALDWSEE